jgi:hypothetical protein
MTENTKEMIMLDPVFGRLTCLDAYDVDPMWMPKFNLKTLPDPIGILWESQISLKLFGKKQRVQVIVTSADWAEVLGGKYPAGHITDAQRHAYQNALGQWADIDAQLATAVLKRYHHCIEYIDYGHHDFKPVANLEELLPTLSEPIIHVPWQETPPERVGFSCNCTWEDEHGFGARFDDGKLVASGNGDIAFD